jgi:hypothetical protein
MIFARAVAPLLFLVALAPGCETLHYGLGSATSAERAPVVTSGQLSLRRAPSLRSLAAWYCPRVITNPVLRLGCTAAFGPPPRSDQLVFEFGLPLRIANPNNFPVPSADVLVALTLFDGQSAQSLGATCLSFCAANDPRCTGAPQPGACEARSGDILTMRDLVNAVPRLVSDVVTGRAAQALRQGTLAAGGDVTLDLSYQLGVDQALSLVERTSRGWVESQLKNRTGELRIPVSARGTVFFRLPVLGRVGVGYGPVRSSWRVL